MPLILGAAYHTTFPISTARLATLNAQSKGRRLGIFKPHEEKPREAREKERGEEFWIAICGGPVPAKNTDDGIRAFSGDKPVEPESTQRYLERKFGEELEAASTAMEKVAKAYEPKELATEAFRFYEKFRSQIPFGKKGWGAKGDVYLAVIEKLAKKDG